MTVFGSRRALEALQRVKASAETAAGALRSRASRQARRQLALKDGEIAALRRELARAHGDPDTPPGDVSPGTLVFFVVGQQKSGTTWLMRMLDAHPEILCRGEGRFFGADWRQEGVKRLDQKRPPSSLYNAILGSEYLRLWVERSVWSRNDDPDEHIANLTRMAVDYFLVGELAKTGKRMVGDKSPLLTPETIEEISAIYPEARVIHIIRDGRDAAVSAAHHSRNFGKRRRDPRTKNGDRRQGSGGSVFAAGQLEKLAADWSSRVGRTVEDGPSLLGEGYTEVRYEDLLARPEEELRRLIGFLGAAASEEAARRCVSSASFERLSKGRKRGEENPSSFFRKGVAGDWRNAFTEEDRRVFKEAAGGLLVKLGYERDDDW